MHDSHASLLPEEVNEPRPKRQGSTVWLALVLLIALAIRLFIIARMGMISRDGATFIWYAQALGREPIHALRDFDQHPLYPALILVIRVAMSPLRRLCPNTPWISDAVLGWQTAGILATLLSGLAAILAIYTLTRVLFNVRVAFWAALLLALAAEFAQLSADALSDMTHLSLYILATAFAIRGIAGARVRHLLIAGILSGAAFLCRPEGAEVALAACLVLLLMPQRVLMLGADTLPTRWFSRQRFTCIVSVAIGALLVAGPYMLITGKLIRKKPVDQFVSAVQMHQLAALHAGEWSSISVHPVTLAGEADLPKPIRAEWLIIEKYTRTLRVTLILPALAFFVLYRRQPSAVIEGAVSDGADDSARRFLAGYTLILTLVLLHIIVVVRLLFRFNDYWEMLSLRHVLVMGALTLPFSAAGIVLLIERVSLQKRRLVSAALLLALIGPTLPWMLARRNVQDVYLRQAGEWIRTQQPAGARILTTRNMVPFYANGVHIWSPHNADLTRILAEARVEHPDWLVFDERRIKKEAPRFFFRLSAAAQAGETIEEVPSFRQTNDDQYDVARVYRYHAAGR